MAETQTRVFEASGGVWAQLRVEAVQAAAEEPLLASYLHASILHLLGIDHELLTFYHNGIERRLTNVHGHVLQDVIA